MWMTLTLSVSCLGKSHADSTLSGTDFSLCKSFSLASLRSRIAFFSESDSVPRALPFSSFQGPVKKKKQGRGFEQPDKRAHAGSMPACLAITSERAFACPLHPARSASLRGCKRHDLVCVSDNELDDSHSLGDSDAEELSGSATDPALLPSSASRNARLRADEELIRVMTKAVKRARARMVSARGAISQQAG